MNARKAQRDYPCDVRARLTSRIYFTMPIPLLSCSTSECFAVEIVRRGGELRVGLRTATSTIACGCCDSCHCLKSPRWLGACGFSGSMEVPQGREDGNCKCCSLKSGRMISPADISLRSEAAERDRAFGELGNTCEARGLFSSPDSRR